MQKSAPAAGPGAGPTFLFLPVRGRSIKKRLRRAPRGYKLISPSPCRHQSGRPHTWLRGASPNGDSPHIHPHLRASGRNPRPQREAGPSSHRGMRPSSFPRDPSYASSPSNPETAGRPLPTAPAPGRAPLQPGLCGIGRQALASPGKQQRHYHSALTCGGQAWANAAPSTAQAGAPLP